MRTTKTLQPNLSLNPTPLHQNHRPRRPLHLTQVKMKLLPRLFHSHPTSFLYLNPVYQCLSSSSVRCYDLPHHTMEMSAHIRAPQSLKGRSSLGSVCDNLQNIRVLSYCTRPFISLRNPRSSSDASIFLEQRRCEPASISQ